MAKVIEYRVLVREVNYGTEDNPDIKQVTRPMTITCPTQSVYDANYPIAEKEAIPCTIEVTGEFDPEPDTTTTDDVLNVLLGVSA